MSDQQRRPGAPEDTEGKRRLRAVSYPDPYLVTKLPLEGTVNSGVIRLGERMLLGFIHRPYPDGTRVRVVYDEWLFAERIEERAGGEEGGNERELGRSSKGPKEDSKASTSKVGGEVAGGEVAGGEVAGGEVAGGEVAGGEVAGGDPAKGAVGSKEPAKSKKSRPKKSGSKSSSKKADSEPKGAMESGDEADNRFPDDFGDPDQRTGDEIGGQQDAWTDAFGEDER